MLCDDTLLHCFRVSLAQTWLSYSHPDNESNVKLKHLKHFLREATSGKMTIHAAMDGEAMGLAKKIRLTPSRTQTIAFVWFDLYSVPQADPIGQGKAIASLPTYVANSTFFLVLAGPWEHENGSVRDSRAWYKRGWCRCAATSPPLPILQHTDQPQRVVLSRALARPAGLSS